MLREDRELLADLKRVCNYASQFALEFMAGELSVAAEEVYASRLIDIAERMLLHAKARKGLVLHDEPTPLILDAEFVRVEYHVPELPSVSTSGDGWS